MDEIDLDEMEEAEEGDKWSSPCRCGDHYLITLNDLEEGLSVVQCAGCSLCVRIIYEEVS